MAKIGTFKKAKGEYRGAIASLALSVDAVRIVPEDSRPLGLHPLPSGRRRSQRNRSAWPRPRRACDDPARPRAAPRDGHGAHRPA